MSKKDQHDLFDVGPRSKPKIIRHKRASHVWTENKAKLIERYLKGFLMVTRHGTYIDAFAGPQDGTPDAVNWAARRVLHLRPPWLRHFALFEHDPERVGFIRRMLKRLPRAPLGKKMRDIKVIEGDSNIALPRHLGDYAIRSREATFCLLDQWTNECHWSTVQTLATHKRKGLKIELFYFFANSWLLRSLKSTTKSIADLDAWWGSDGWRDLLTLDSYARAAVCWTASGTSSATGS